MADFGIKDERELLRQMVRQAGINLPEQWIAELTGEFSAARDELALVHSIAARAEFEPLPYDDTSHEKPKP